MLRDPLHLAGTMYSEADFHDLPHDTGDIEADEGDQPPDVRSIFDRPPATSGEIPGTIEPLPQDSDMAFSSLTWPRTFEQSMAMYSLGTMASPPPSRPPSHTFDHFTPPSFLPHGISDPLSPAGPPPRNRRHFLSESNIAEPLLHSEHANIDYVHRDRRSSYKDRRSGEGECGLGEDDEWSEDEEVDRVGDSHHIPGGQAGSSSTSGAMFNGINALVGVGILSTPYAVAQGGWLGLLIFLAFALIFYNTGLFLRDCMESRDGLVTYPDIGQAAFGPWGRWLVAILLYIELYSVTVDLFIMEGDNLASLFPSVSLDLGFYTLSSNETMLVITALVVLPTVCLRDLSFLAYLSMMGISASILVVGAVGWMGTLGGVGLGAEGRVVNWSGVPVAIGVYSFCFSGHTVMPNIYWSMKDRSQFSQVLAVSFLVASFLYGSMAVLGYLMFGEEVQSQITLNLPRDSLVTLGAVWTTVVNPLTKFALMMTPLALGIEELFPWGPHAKATVFFGTLVRTALVLSAMCVALLVPFFGFVMAFIGSFLGVTMSVIFPSLCFLRIVNKASYWRRRQSVLYILVGLVAAGFGTYSSVVGIMRSFDHPGLGRHS